MPTIHFVSHDGQRHSIDVPAGTTLMRAATDHGVPGIDGDCGGQCACATCHVYVNSPWAERLPPIQERENNMLEFSTERQDSSRLGCQIVVSEELDGMEVHTPLGQH